MGSVVTVLASFILSVICVFVVLKISQKKSWYDTINDRKIHTGDIPRLGGIGFAVAFIITAFFVTLFDPEFSPGLRFMLPIGALIIILISGVVDDFTPLSPAVKLFIQGLCALCVIISGYTFTRPFFTGTGWLSALGWTAYPFSFIWIVGLANAMNFIDGIDGLAGGISVLIAISYAAIFFFLSDTGPGILFSLCLAAVILGFLIFNVPLPKARIFMGDGGSQFLGFILALLPLIVDQEARNTLPMFHAGALVLIPVYDTVAAIWRRLREHRRIDSPDKAHIHHKLMNLGLSYKQIDAVLYSLQIFLGAMVLLSIKITGLLSIIFLGAAYAGCLAFFAVIHYLNRSRLKSVKNASVLPVSQ
ncbi:MAG: undecaprenyl/decaprenyl-phosphate alpha-N-acetylglucosaminyl 1-phosphate transferase [Treponema sp.]|jgi:UDP-GlcNAc:undecaprenyl-phosphate GlcNAc-1-phosphate transferase|nr:undecaprenyl/decaprenyl-phosphate alpha-N-acetylglucosaminyl 1-phosphate transferase [Treponema sp.]